MDFSKGGWLIMSQPNGLLILGDHLFSNYIFFGGQWWWLIGGFINPHLTLYGNISGKGQHNNLQTWMVLFKKLWVHWYPVTWPFGFAAAETTQAVESLARQLLQSRFQCRVAGEFFSQLGA